MQKRTAPVPVIFCSVIGYMEIYIKVDRRSQIIAQISETGKISKDRVERPEGRRLAPENGDIFGSIFGGCLASPNIVNIVTRRGSPTRSFSLSRHSLRARIAIGCRMRIRFEPLARRRFLFRFGPPSGGCKRTPPPCNKSTLIINQIVGTVFPH